MVCASSLPRNEARRAGHRFVARARRRAASALRRHARVARARVFAPDYGAVGAIDFGLCMPYENHSPSGSAAD